MDSCINVCLSCDDNYSKYAAVVIASILANADNEDEITFYILDGGIEAVNKEKICSLKKIKKCKFVFVEIEENLFSVYRKIKTHSYITQAAYYRLKLPSLLKDIARVIYFDCDFVVNKSLKELFYMDLKNYPLAGVVDIDRRKTKKNLTYVNSGMLLFDLDKFRELKLEENFEEWTLIHSDVIKMGDQEIINSVCMGKILTIDETWNVQSSNFTNRSSYTRKPKAIHFVARKKPWHFGSFSYHKSYYFKYLQLTPWALKDEEKGYWYIKNQFISLINYFFYRPFFMLRPRFYKAVFYTYILPLFVRGE